MKTILFALTMVAIACGVAHADELKNPDAPQSLAALWPMLAVGAANLVAVLIPRASAEFSFFHTAAGKAALTIFGTFVSAIPSAVQAHGLCWAMLAWAALGAISTLTSAMSTAPRGGTGLSNASLVLFLAAGAAGMLAGCATTGGQALGKCELGQLSQQLQPTIADVVAIADAGGENYQQTLEQLGAQLLPGQLDCAVQAIVAAWSSSRGQIAPARREALQRLQQYQATHPKATACGRRGGGA